MIYYHVTRKGLVGRILEEGLRTDGGTPGFDFRYVWFFDDLELAEQMAPKFDRHGGGVIIAVDTTDLIVVSDPHPGWGDWKDNHSFAHEGAIPPGRLRLLERTTV